jgi:hypothetical protein
VAKKEARFVWDRNRVVLLYIAVLVTISLLLSLYQIFMK